MRRLSCFFLVLLLCVACLPGRAEQDGFYDAIPPALQVTQSMKTEVPGENIYIQCTYPTCANADVQKEIRGLVDDMTARDRKLLPGGASQRNELDVGACIWRTGTKWMSFVVLSQLTVYRTVTHTDYASRVYDMETGERVLLSDVIARDSEGFDIIRQAVISQLSAYYPGMKTDEEKLGALVTDESLASADFVMSVACMRLVYHASCLYEGRETLMYVTVPYSDIRACMTAEALRQTDNSRYRKVALTFDDGPAGGYTKRLTYALRDWGAQATFFIVGERMESNQYNMVRGINMGYSLQSHTWTHDYLSAGDEGRVLSRRDRMAEAFRDMIGTEPVMMRAPGGREAVYISAECGYPLIHWSVISGDADFDKSISSIIGAVSGVRDGDIVLMHDLNSHVYEYGRTILERLAARGFLCVTVDELFMDAGIALKADRVYYNAREKN